MVIHNMRVLIAPVATAKSIFFEPSLTGAKTDSENFEYRERGVPVTFWATALAGNETVKFYYPKTKTADLAEAGDWVDSGVELNATNPAETIFAGVPLKITKSITASACGLNCSL
jgi:hypothetical protein